MKFYTVENNKKSILKTFAIYYICMAVFVGIRISTLLIELPSEIWVDVVYSIIVQAGIIFILPLLLYCLFLKVTPKQVFKTCNFNKMNFNTILISIGLGFICFGINIVVSSLSSGLIGFTGYRSSSSGIVYDYNVLNFFLDIFSVAILPAFCEEFLHRGIVLQGTKHMGFKKAIVISSLLFGLLHFSIQKVFYAFVIGLVLGLVSVVAKNIWVGIIIHFVNNAFSVYLDYARANNLLFGNMLDGLSEWLMTTPFIWVFICCSLFVIALISLLILFIWLLYKQAMLGKVKRALDKAYNSSDINKNTNVLINKDSVFNDLLEQNTLLNLTYRKMDNPIDIVLPKEKSRYKTTFKDNIFMIGAVVLGAVITIFTYIWGLL